MFYLWYQNYFATFISFEMFPISLLFRGKCRHQSSLTRTVDRVGSGPRGERPNPRRSVSDPLSGSRWHFVMHPV